VNHKVIKIKIGKSELKIKRNPQDSSEPPGIINLRENSEPPILRNP